MQARRFLTLGVLALWIVSPLAVSAAEPAPAAAPPTPAEPQPGHSLHGEVFNEGPRQKAYLMGNTGNVSLQITAKSPQAQEFFNQGLGQMHGFWYFEAERSFRQAAALDPDCAMAYWGMALANRENEKRGKGFIDEAVKRKAAASPREQLWIDALAAFFNAGADLKTRDEKRRRREYVRALEKIIHQFPDEIEAKAFVGVEIWLNSRFDLPIGSHEAADALLREVHAANPMHPAHHYRIHLWDAEKPERALKSASLCGQSAPGIAHMWHMPGHTYSKLKRYTDAVWQQDASARVDHAHMMRDRVMPDQIHNYAHNNDWLVENLGYIGRVRDAIDLAKNLVELPRHPRYNTLARGGSGKMGRNRLFQLLSQYELWDELIALCQTPCLAPTDNEDDQIKRLRALGAAYLAKGDLEHGRAQIASLTEMLNKLKAEQQAAGNTAEAKAREEKKPDDQTAKAKADALAGFDSRIKNFESALNELQGRWALAGSDYAVALQHFEKADGMAKEALSRAWLQAGNKAKAEQTAREAVEQGANRVYPLANYVEILQQLGKTAEATENFKKLQAASGSVDMAAPIFQRLTALAPQLGLPTEWRQPLKTADDVGVRPELEQLGPFRWSPSPAPEWSLVDAEGKPVTLAQFRGKPAVVIFYLGFGCLHCVEQLQTFSPLYKEYADAGISIVGISSESMELLKQGLAKRQQNNEPALPIPLLANGDLSIFKEYRCFDDFENMPLHGTFLIDGEGLVRWQDISYDPFTDAKFLLAEAKRLLNSK